eukprot:scaffold4209_cov445-Pinguiococcus_pyrenoidosus.AAC.2
MAFTRIWLLLAEMVCDIDLARVGFDGAILRISAVLGLRPSSGSAGGKSSSSLPPMSAPPFPPAAGLRCVGS